MNTSLFSTNELERLITALKVMSNAANAAIKIEPTSSATVAVAVFVGLFIGIIFTYMINSKMKRKVASKSADKFVTWYSYNPQGSNHTFVHVIISIITEEHQIKYDNEGAPIPHTKAVLCNRFKNEVFKLLGHTNFKMIGEPVKVKDLEALLIFGDKFTKQQEAEKKAAFQREELNLQRIKSIVEKNNNLNLVNNKQKSEYDVARVAE